MNILFIGRLDYPPKQGGDAIQIENYKKIISQKGHHVEIASLINEPGNYDFVDLFNISRVYDLIYQLNSKVKNIPILILHPIHQKKEYLHRMKSLGVKIPGSERLKFITRNILSNKFRFNQLLLIFRNEKKLIHSLLNKIAFFHFLSPKEREWFENDFGYKIDNEKLLIFENAVSYAFDNSKPLKDREIDILISGRIEPQKNSINTAKCLTSFKDKRIVFAGQMNRYYKAYCNEFLKIVQQNGNFKYIGSKSFSGMQELYGNSKIVFSLSLSEAAPRTLVELEALANKAIFIGTNRKPIEGSNINTGYYIDPENLSEAAELLKEIFNKIESGFNFTFPHINTWEEEIEPLLNLYKQFEK
ncbi:MAG TPA: glycosyltransferase [Ignavibacteriaceae bacterium]|nr:glycosyltransferase [Ignavibacteriaceae bacterium]